jgi:putative Ca2+/H+ antiporter (TMEM165/GDT1 family)
MGDKTQIATVALGARFNQLVPVTMGTTLGMMIANVPAVFLGNELIKRVPLQIVRTVAALLFLAIGLWLLAQTAGWL